LIPNNSRQSLCEWKGRASYYDLKTPTGQPVRARIWTYKSPTGRFSPLKDHIAFYVGPWTCEVDGEKVVPQDGDFYGGWKISDIDGGKSGMKGAPGTEYW